MKGAKSTNSAELRRKREAQDLLALDIAKGDTEGVTLTIRAAIERGYAESFNESLHESLKKKEAEIDRICARNYSDFLGSISDMLKMRGAAADLTKIMGVIHKDFQESGEKMVDVLTKLQSVQVERAKTRDVLASVMRCKDASK